MIRIYFEGSVHQFIWEINREKLWMKYPGKVEIGDTEFTEPSLIEI